MTRKDYELIAGVLKNFTGDTNDTIDRDAIAYDLADALALDNPRFQHDAFLIAAGVYTKCDHCSKRASAFSLGMSWCQLHKGKGLIKEWASNTAQESINAGLAHSKELGY